MEDVLDWYWPELPKQLDEKFVTDKFESSKKDLIDHLSKKETLAKVILNLSEIDSNLSIEQKTIKAINIINQAKNYTNTVTLTYNKLQNAFGEYNKGNHTITIDLEAYKSSNNPKEQVSNTIKHELLHASQLWEDVINKFFIEKNKNEKNILKNQWLEIKKIEIKGDWNDDIDMLMKTISDNLDKQSEWAYFLNNDEIYVRFRIMQDKLKELWYTIDNDWVSQLFFDIISNPDESKYKNIMEIYQIFDGNREWMIKILNNVVDISKKNWNQFSDIW